jgi:trehalose 6-phosphate synthase
MTVALDVSPVRKDFIVMRTSVIPARAESTPAAPGSRAISPTQRVILVSNRGPIEYVAGANGLPEARRGAGGVVSGLLSALEQRPVTWIALAMTEADRVAAARARNTGIHAPGGVGNLDLHLVDIPPRVYQSYYDDISNRLLWFAQHYLLRPTAPSLFSARVRARWNNGYRAANRAVADAVVATLERRGPHTPVVFQDYHLYLAPEYVRERVPTARLAHFVHIPWPDPRYWEMLPDYLVRDIYQGLAANDSIGFQTSHDVDNFLEGAGRFLPGATVMRGASGAASVLRWRGQQVWASVHPIALTPDHVRAAADSAEAEAKAAALARRLRLDERHRLIVRVDRVEPTKNIVRGFQAYERLLQQHPELRGQVTFLALLVPSRQTVGRYRAYAGQVQRIIARINARFGSPAWQPIVAVFDNDRARALACMRRYDVLLVNPLLDGMNLVAKEGGLVNTRSGVIVLSRTAGAYEQLGEHVLGITPLDVEQTAEELYRALTMPRRERARRARAMRAVLEQESATLWLEAVLATLDHVSRRKAAASAPDASESTSGRQIVGYASGRPRGPRHPQRRTATPRRAARPAALTLAK